MTQRHDDPKLVDAARKKIADMHARILGTTLDECEEDPLLSDMLRPTLSRLYELLAPHEKDTEGRVTIPEQEYRALLEDKANLDFLEEAHQALNDMYGTDYGWELIINHNVVRAMVKNCHPREGRDGIDLNDAAGGHAKISTCRETISRKRKEYHRDKENRELKKGNL